MKLFRNFFVLLFLIFFSTRAYSLDTSLGVYRFNDHVQDGVGQEDSDPLSPMVTIGHNMGFLFGLEFSPQLGFIKHTTSVEDEYGGDYSITSFVLLYDFLWSPELLQFSGGGLKVRFGAGTFIKKTKGEGGPVTIPNGSGTATAYRPGESTTSYSSTVNLGFDALFNLVPTIFTNSGLRLEYFVFGIKESEKRVTGTNISFVGYF